MNGKFNEQKEALEALLHEIKLLGRQIVYLLRNEQEVDLLDIDVMLRRTHTIYDQICAFEPLPDDEFDWDEPKEPANLANLEGSANLANLTNLEEEEAEDEALEEKMEEKVEEHIEEKTEEKEEKEEEAEEVTDFGFIFKPEEPEPVVQEEEIKEEIVEETKVEVEEETKDEAKEETLAFDFNISAGEIEEPEIPETPETETEKEVYTTGDQIEMVIPHIENSLFETQNEETEEEIPVEENTSDHPAFEEDTSENPTFEDHPFEEETAEDLSFEDNTFEENQFEEETAEDNTFEEDTTEENHFEEDTAEEVSPQQDESYPYEPILFGDMEEKEEAGFEIIQEILGEKLQAEDHSLAAKLQHKPVKDLKTAIGINDKFLLVNELFGGSMERYNKSIENLNDLPTLDGALGYLDELYVEYQWNRNNEAYKKLMDLVHRKFEN